jgi:hypothetical protein
MRRPFFWKARKAGLVKTDDRRNLDLTRDEKTALMIWAKMTAAERPEAPTAPVQLSSPNPGKQA